MRTRSSATFEGATTSQIQSGTTSSGRIVPLIRVALAAPARDVRLDDVVWDRANVHRGTILERTSTAGRFTILGQPSSSSLSNAPTMSRPKTR